jgi:hypothetical protein
VLRDTSGEVRGKPDFKGCVLQGEVVSRTYSHHFRSVDRWLGLSIEPPSGRCETHRVPRRLHGVSMTLLSGLFGLTLSYGRGSPGHPTAASYGWNELRIVRHQPRLPDRRPRNAAGARPPAHALRRDEERHEYNGVVDRELQADNSGVHLLSGAASRTCVSR